MPDTPVQTDFIMPRQDGVYMASGIVANRLLQLGFNTDVMRPFVGPGNQGAYINHYNRQTKEVESVAIQNAAATLNDSEWLLIDETVNRVAAAETRLVADLRAAGLQRVIPNGMGKTVLQYGDMSDISAATISMDPARRGESDRPVFTQNFLPLPVIYKDWDMSLRELEVSRNDGAPLDTTMAELATQKVVEGIEQLALGVWPTYAFGGGTVYGLTNYTNRLTYSLTAPTAGGWTGNTLITQLLAMRAALEAKFMRGPYMIYVSPNWGQYLDADFSAAKGDLTLRERIRQIEGFIDVRTLEYLANLTNNPYTILMVQWNSRTIQIVVGQEIRTVQWETEGGFLLHFKTLAIMVPLIRCDQNNQCGLNHGSAAS